MARNDELRLTPAQQRAAETLLAALPSRDVFVLRARARMGKTAVLRFVHSQTGGALLGINHFLDALIARGPGAAEETFLQVLDNALAKHDLLLVDDFHLIAHAVEACDYQRTHMFDAGLTALLGEASAYRKKMVFATAGDSPWPIQRRAHVCEILSMPGAADSESAVRLPVPAQSC